MTVQGVGYPILVGFVHITIECYVTRFPIIFLSILRGIDTLLRMATVKIV